MFYACPTILDFLIGRGADVNAFGDKSFGDHYGTPLIAACSSSRKAQERLRIVKTLVQNGANIHAGGRLGDNAMQAASSNALAKIVAFLLLEGADVDSRGGKYGTAIIAACSNNGEKEKEIVETVNLLITNGADINYVDKQCGSALYEATIRGYHDVVKLLIAAKADVNICSDPTNAPLVATCRGKQNDMKFAKLFLDNGADINASENFAVRAASIFGSKELVTFFVKNGAGLMATESGSNALHCTALNARADTADTLIAFGLDINSHDSHWGTPLHFACSAEADKLLAKDTHKHEKRLAMVKSLVEKEADVNARRAGGISVLQDALKTDDQELVDFLVANGAADHVGKESNREEDEKSRVETNDDGAASHDGRGRRVRQGHI